MPAPRLNAAQVPQMQELQWQARMPAPRVNAARGPRVLFLSPAPSPDSLSLFLPRVLNSDVLRQNIVFGVDENSIRHERQRGVELRRGIVCYNA